MNKTVLITGASRGIGAEIARQFAQNGDKVVINYIQRADAAAQLIAEIIKQGGTAMAIQADIAVRKEVEEMFHIIEQNFGQVDILIHNAGIAQQKMFCDITEKEWDRMFDVMVKGAYHCIQQVLPSMVHNKCGKIIIMSSMWGQVGASCEVHYSAAKGALIALTKALAKELGPSGIQINCIAPGVVATEMNQNLSEETLQELREETPLGRIGTAEDIANMTMFLASDRSDFITGQILGINGGIVI